MKGEGRGGAETGAGWGKGGKGGRKRGYLFATNLLRLFTACLRRGPPAESLGSAAGAANRITSFDPKESVKAIGECSAPPRRAFQCVGG